MLFRIALIIVLFLPVGVAAAGETEIRAAQNTITAQIEAFRAGDDQAAYSHAAPNIVRIFPDVGSFMTMVERGYRPVQKPASYGFGRSRELNSDHIVQEVHITGPDGKEYSAVYQLLRQSDGSWKISSVSLARTDGQTT